MKTIGVDKYGGSDVPRVASVRIPEPAPGQGSVMDKAASINPSKANAAFATAGRPSEEEGPDDTSV